MSTLVAQTISNGTVSTSSANVIQGSAKAWVNFNGVSGSVAIRASYNVSSITRNSAGNYTVNFTNALTDANYAAVIYSNGSVSTSGTSYNTNGMGGAGGRTTTSINVVTNTSSGPTDSALFDVAVFR